MRPPKLIEQTDIPLCDIDCTNRLRPVTETAVASLRTSIETLGLQSEIHVRRIKKTGRLRLMAGGHRIEVFRELERETIPAKIWDCTDEMAELFEIDDNLAHAELDTLELAVFLARRKIVHERVYPQAKAAIGTELVNKRWHTADNLSVVSFAATAAEKMGVSERKVFRLLAAGTALGPEEVGRLRNAPRKVTLADLQIIAKCNNPVDRHDIVDGLAEGTATSAKEVMNRKAHPGAAIADPIEDAFRQLLNVFERAPMAARRRFVSETQGVLSALISELGGEQDAA